PETYTLSLHDALPICILRRPSARPRQSLGPDEVARGLTHMVHFQESLLTPREERLVSRDLAVIVIDNVPPGLLDTEAGSPGAARSEEHTSELQSRGHL